MLVEQVSTMGGGLLWITVTVNEQLVVVPQVSLAVQVTLLVPSGKLLPLAGVQLTDGGLQPPLAVEV